MERQRLQAIKALEIYGNSVKCQRCGIEVPIVGKLNRPCNDRIVISQRRINHIENYSHGYYNNREKESDLKALRQELSELLEEMLRSLPFSRSYLRE
jgi:uncharacterized C2H2 Zn-finger protein